MILATDKQLNAAVKRETETWTLKRRLRGESQNHFAGNEQQVKVSDRVDLI